MMNENTTMTQAQVEGFGIDTKVPMVPQDVLDIDYAKAFASYTEQEQKEIMELANAIDVRKIDNVMRYGSVALKATFEQCGAFLKDERGSKADQEVIAQVIALSKKASESYDDFNLVLQEPNVLQKFFLKLMGAGRNSRTQKIKNSAVTNYKLLAELRASCDSWLIMLKNAMGEIEYSAISDADNIALLEKYIIAGKIAEQRISQELDGIQAQYQETGLQRYSQEYDTLKEGFHIFQITMGNLEKSRIMYHLSIGQLALIKRGNTNVQISIHTQVDNSMALIGQQLRNAVLDAKTREVLEGQTAIARLSDELIKEVSTNVGLTTEQTERLLYASFYNTEAAKEAVTTVINSCETIRKVASEMLPKMKADVSQLNELIKQLEPAIGSIERMKIDAPKTTTVEGGLKF